MGFFKRLDQSRLKQVQKAYQQKDVSASQEYHQDQKLFPDHEPHLNANGKFIGDAVYGASDGIITTFAIVSGVIGAALSPTVVFILGLANLLADGFSMAASNYLAIRSEQDYYRKERERERWEVHHIPEDEREEIRKIYREKGFQGDDLQRAVEIITSDEERWINTMMMEELLISPEQKKPIHAALVTFFSFLIAGSIPLIGFLSFFWQASLQPYAFVFAASLTSATMFGIGAARSVVIHSTWLRSGMEMFLVGSLAAAVSYGVGYALQSFA